MDRQLGNATTHCCLMMVFMAFSASIKKKRLVDTELHNSHSKIYEEISAP